LKLETKLPLRVVVGPNFHVALVGTVAAVAVVIVGALVVVRPDKIDAWYIC
jgi:hypothetical protein